MLSLAFQMAIPLKKAIDEVGDPRLPELPCRNQPRPHSVLGVVLVFLLFEPSLSLCSLLCYLCSLPLLFSSSITGFPTVSKRHLTTSFALAAKMLAAGRLSMFPCLAFAFRTSGDSIVGGAMSDELLLTSRASLLSAVIIHFALLAAATPIAPVRNAPQLRQRDLRELAAAPAWADLVRRAGSPPRKNPSFPFPLGYIPTSEHRDKQANSGVPSTLRQMPTTTSLRHLSDSLTSYGRDKVRRVYNPATGKYDVVLDKSSTRPGPSDGQGYRASLAARPADQRQVGVKGKAPQEGSSRPSKTPRFDPFGLAATYAQPNLASQPGRPSQAPRFDPFGLAAAYAQPNPASQPKSNPHAPGPSPATAPVSHGGDVGSPSRWPQHWPNFFNSDTEGSPRAGPPAHHHHRR